MEDSLDDIKDGLEKKFYALNYEVEKPIPIKNKNAIGLMKDDLSCEMRK